MDIEIKYSDFDYKYPSYKGKELDLRPESELHKRIVEEVTNRARESYAVVSQQHALWDEIDDTMRLHVDLSKEEQERKQRDPKKLVSIVMPFSYATREVLLTYLYKALLNDPIYRYSPVAPEDMRSAMILEQVVALQSKRAKHGLSLLSQFSDILTYGIGVISPVWETKTAVRSSPRNIEVFDEFGNLANVRQSSEEAQVIFEGNTLRNIDVRRYLPDPHVDINHIQDGEFIGYCETVPYTALLDMESRNPEMIFNVRYLKGITNGHSAVAQPEEYVYPFSRNSRPMDTIYMYVNLIPEEWEIGNSEYPEKWLFGVTADQTVIMAMPAGLNHGMYPIVAASCDPAGHDVLPMGRMELIKGMQQYSDFLVNLMAINQMKGVNDRLIIDPSLINYFDVIDNKPGGVIRTRRSAWGRGVEGTVKQLAITDITANNLAMANNVSEVMQRSSGAVDALQGVLQHRNDRVSSTEAQGVMNAAFSRLELIAYIIVMQGQYDLSHMIASQTQQFASRGGILKSLGRWEDAWNLEGQQQGVRYDLEDLQVEYDVVMDETGGVNGEHMQEFIQLFQMAQQNQEIAQVYDIPKFFAHIARMGGIKNMADYRRQQPMVPQGQPTQMTVVSDNQFAQMKSAGNIAPMGAF